MMIVGDFNLPGINWTTDSTKPYCQYKSLHAEFLSFLMEHNITQVINEPTHVKGNTLDLVCTTQPFNVTAQVIAPGVSDHHLLSVELRHSIPPTKNPADRCLKLYRQVDIDLFQDLLWPTQNALAEMDDVDEMWSLFVTELKNAVNKSVPVKQIKAKRSNEPAWFNKAARKIVQKQRKTYNKSSNPFFKRKYESERRSGKKQLKIIKQSYLKNRICRPLESGNSKPFFRHLKWIQNTTKPPLKLSDANGSYINDPKACATLLNLFFGEQFCSDSQITGDPKYEGNNSSKIEINSPGVEKLLQSLKFGKAPGPDGLRKEDLTIDPIMTARCLSHIFNVSLNNSKLPRAWKLAHVSPLHKRGASDQLNNYRPISLTSIPCKLMEHIVLHYLNQTLDTVLHDRQHGFRKGLSCESQLCATYHDIAHRADRGDTIHAAVMDFTKAFDKVPHQLLMKKLSIVPNIDSKILMWIHDFLRDRKQCVVIDQNQSPEIAVTSGVPQGSVLGPTLFLVYINDLPEQVSCEVSLFADDTLIYQSVNSQIDQTEFQANIAALAKWADTWCMSFNAAKCSIMSFNQTSAAPAASYTLNNTPLNTVQQSKYLGVTLQSDLKFSSHIQLKVSKAKQQLGMIKQALHGAPQDAKLLAYLSLCRPHVEFASSVWDPTLEYQINSIEMVQHKAIRFICNLKGRESISAAADKLEINTLKERRKGNRHSLLLRILSKENNHQALTNSYDKLINDRPDDIAITRAASKQHPATIYAKSSTYHGSFLPKTIRELKSKT